MIVYNDDIVSRELQQPFVRLFWHCVGVSRDGGHVKGFVKVFFPRVSYWSKGKCTMEKVFDNGRFEGKASSVNLRRFEPLWGNVLRECYRTSCRLGKAQPNHQMETT
jgi:hypothetical protein